MESDLISNLDAAMQDQTKRLALVLALCTLPTALRAQSSSASVHPSAPPVSAAVARAGSVAIDGKLDESAWAGAQAFTDFRQFQPTEGARPSYTTELRILYDNDALYIGARL